MHRKFHISLVLSILSIVMLYSLFSASIAFAKEGSVRAVTVFPNHQILSSSKVVQASVHSAVTPLDVPDCLIVTGDSEVISEDTWLDYHIDSWVTNNCGVSTVNGGGWTAHFYAECEGFEIDEGSIEGGLLPLSNGQKIAIIDGNYQSICTDSAGNEYPPAMDIWISASAYLSQDLGARAGSTELIV